MVDRPTSDTFWASIRPEAVACPHAGADCGSHEDCEGRCGGIVEETIYFLRGDNHGHTKHYPNYRSIVITSGTEVAAETRDQLRGARALNGQPLFEVKVLSEQAELARRRGPWWETA